MAIKGFNFYAERPVMRSLYIRKKSGVELGKEQLTYDVLKKLWADEFVRDSDIAEMFNMSASDVHNMREARGITHTSVVMEYAERAASVLGNLGASIMTA